ncbi:DUF4422 domain-containing protein [Agromyces intestinalis]|nr:DUF4422 domain-containing protein [Agromyces intestinalis]
MLTAAHKQAPLPDDPGYFPVHVGHIRASHEFGYQPDDEGENISVKNDSYCELTALYWAWKNLKADAIGLSHYRRYFRGDAPGPNGSRVLSTDQMGTLMSTTDVAIARPRYYIVESIESHYRHGHIGDDLEVLRQVIRETSLGYSPSFEAVMRRRHLSLYNMFLMRGEHFDAYASWLFPILEDVEQRIDNESRGPYQRRTFGYLGERLLNVWVHAHSENLHVKYLPVVNTDGEPKIAKGLRMVQRKLAPAPPSRA